MKAQRSTSCQTSLCVSQAPCLLTLVSMICWNRAQTPLREQNSEGLSDAVTSLLSSGWTSRSYVIRCSFYLMQLPWFWIQEHSSAQRHCIRMDKLGLTLLQVFLVPCSSGWCRPTLCELEAQIPQISNETGFDITKGFILLWWTLLFLLKQPSYKHRWGTQHPTFQSTSSVSLILIGGHVVDHQQFSCLWV